MDRISLAKKLDLPLHCPTLHGPAPHHVHLLSDAPRILACLHRQQPQQQQQPTAVHVVCAAPDDAPAGAPAVVAYVLSEEANHAGPRFGMVTAGEPAVALAASRTALQCIADLNLDSLRFFGLPEPAVAAADSVLPPRGYARCSHNPCTGYTLRGGLPEAALRRGREEAARLAAEGYALGRLRREDAELVDSLWPYRSAWSLPFIRDKVIGGGLATACARDAAGSPVAWAVEYEDGSFGMLTTLEPHRQRGLARAVLIELLTQLLLPRGGGDDTPCGYSSGAAAPACKESSCSGFVNGGCTPFAYVVETNAPSRALLLSLGFEEMGVFSWQRWERRGPGGGGGA